MNEVNKLDNFSKINFDEKKGLICKIDKEMDNKYIPFYKLDYERTFNNDSDDEEFLEEEEVTDSDSD